MAARAVLFDVDLTLIDSGGASTAAWRIAFRELYGLEIDVGHFAPDGTTDPQVGRRAFAAALGREPSEHELAELMRRRQEHLPDAVAESTGYRVLPGVHETLERLTREGVLVGLTTGLTREAAETKLARGDLNRFFGFGGFGSDSPERSELTRIAVARAGEALGRALAAQEVFAVGDTPRDVDAAHGAGIGCVGVATGHYDPGTLREAGADAVVPDLTHPLPGTLPAAAPHAR